MPSTNRLVPLASHQQPMMGPNTSAEAKNTQPGVEVTGVEVTKRAPRVPWSPSEDYLLMCMVKGKGAHDWEEISTTVGRRSAKQCRERWHQNINPQLNHSPITREEGEVILDWVAQKGPQWAEIGRYLQNRSDNAVKNWYNAMIRRSERSQKAVTSRTTKKTRHTSRRSKNLPPRVDKAQK
ncbi:hypothetical protein E4U57_005834 [Claviceps arundinis]|uniref:Uncharacterized protein n=1 Tax=Claviceps arundinis TaxID=1623583 RepID=A0ABQ7P4R5_9HYPO|nr:hypothetical protein E4U57_005834 [Claviceps arundinis]